jgi:hypothetical protein
VVVETTPGEFRLLNFLIRSAHFRHNGSKVNEQDISVSGQGKLHYPDPEVSTVCGGRRQWVFGQQFIRVEAVVKQ